MTRLTLAEDAAELPALAQTELWLIRHGESEGNSGGRLQGQAETPLTARGAAQARAVAERLRGQPFAGLYSSDLSRARDTAAPIAAAVGLPLVIDPLLREIDIGTWSGLTADAIAAAHPEEWARWQERRSGSHRRGGGESYTDLHARVAPAITAIGQRHPGGRVLVVAHGGTINAYLAGLLGMPFDNVWRLTQDNAAISRVQPFANPNRDAAIPAGRVLVVNDTAHLATVP